MIDLSGVAKVIILVGAIMVMMGIIVLFADRIPWLGKLPGDIYIQRENFTFYFPVMTCIIVSILLSVIFYFITKR